jgi:hypothetical protein
MPDSNAYEIRVREVLDEKWAAYFVPFTLHAGTDETILRGVAHDQAELFGVLLKIRDLGLKLVSVNPVAGLRPPAQAGLSRIQARLPSSKSDRPRVKKFR